MTNYTEDEATDVLERQPPLQGKTIYVAGAIDNAPEGEHTVASAVVSMLRFYGAWVHDPMGDRSIKMGPGQARVQLDGQKRPDQAVEVSRQAVERSAMLVAFLDPGILTWGTISEIELAIELGITVVVVGPSQIGKMAYLLHNSVRFIDTSHYRDDMAAAMGVVERIRRYFRADYFKHLHIGSSGAYTTPEDMRDAWIKANKEHGRVYALTDPPHQVWGQERDIPERGMNPGGPESGTAPGPLATDGVPGEAIPPLDGLEPGIFQWNRDPEHADNLRMMRPEQAHEGDAGWDVYVAEDTTVPGGGFAQVPMGIRFAPPAGQWCLHVGRSSTFKTRHLLVNPGIIDAGWRGPLYADVYNPESSAKVVKAGDRITQLIPMPLYPHRTVWRHVEPLPDASRGENGYGSSGE